MDLGAGVGVVHLEAVAAAMLGARHGGAGVPQQLLRRLVPVAVRDADAGGDEDLVAADLDG